jgi:PTH1 family peptidyl-tRNA hydrolase
MKLIIGLGNPGKEYVQTRHNVGFAVMDFLRFEWGFPDFAPNKKFSADISEGMVGPPNPDESGFGASPEKLRLGASEKVILVKPLTFMNLSGVAVRALVDFYKLTPADVFVIQDELDLPFGTHRLATDSSAAGHNGIKSIIEHLGTQQFHRLRVGISPQNSAAGQAPKSSASGQATSDQSTSCLRNAHDFVLDRFTSEEESVLEKLFPTFKRLANEFIEKSKS